MNRQNQSGPRIYLISRPVLDLDECLEFLLDRRLSWKKSEDASDPENIVEICGRVCYLSFSEDTSLIRHPNAKFLRNLIDKGHESVLEHANWTFIIDGVSRAFTHQLVRHRIGFSFSQLSQQYHEESEANFLPPAGLPDDVRHEWEEAVAKSLKAYRDILAYSSNNGKQEQTLSNRERSRFIRTAARSVLPNATETAIAVTGNARAWRHFLNIRGAIEGDVEMRLVSAELFKRLSAEAPSLFADFELVPPGKDEWPMVVKTEN